MRRSRGSVDHVVVDRPIVNPEISSNTRPIDRLGRSTWLDPLGDAVQPTVRRLLDGPLAPIADLLHGVPLGHSLHVVATDVPVGAWTTALAFDALDVAGRAEFRVAADGAIGFGMLGGLLAIASGYAEWSDTDGEAKRLGTAHAALNGVGFALYGASLAARFAKRRPLGIGLALAAYGLTSLSAYVGGELSTGMQIGVRHRVSPVFPADRFVTVLASDALGDGETKRVAFDGLDALVTRAAGSITAVAAVCTHRGAPFSTDDVAEGCVTCPWHGARFSLVDGSVARGPATFALARFDARERDDEIQLRVIA